MKITKTLLKRYIKRIGIDNFTCFYYDRPNITKSLTCAIKALSMDIINLQDKIIFNRKTKKYFESLPIEKMQELDKLINETYIELC